IVSDISTRTQPLTYTLKLTSNGVTTTDEVTIYPIPAIMFDVNPTNLPVFEMCAGGYVQIPVYVNPSGGTGIYTYQWEPADNILYPNTPNPFLYQAESGLYEYTVTITSGPCNYTYTQKVLVNP